MAFTEDFDAFLGTDDFGVEAVYDSAEIIKVIFDAAYQESLGIGVGVQSYGPRAWTKDSAVDVAPEGKKLVVGTTTYTIQRREQDGTGMSILILSAD